MISPKFPSLEDSAPELRKLKTQPGSIVLIALDSFVDGNACRHTRGWLSSTERKALHVAFERARRRRATAAAEASWRR
jgi:hypothetical protein